MFPCRVQVPLLFWNFSWRCVDTPTARVLPPSLEEGPPTTPPPPPLMPPLCTVSARLTRHTEPLPLLLLSLFSFLYLVLTFHAFTGECPGSSSTQLRSETASDLSLYRHTTVLITSASPFRLTRASRYAPLRVIR